MVVLRSIKLQQFLVNDVWQILARPRTPSILAPTFPTLAIA